MPFRGSLLTCCINREAPSIGNGEDRLESKNAGVQQAKEGENVMKSRLNQTGEPRVHDDALSRGCGYWSEKAMPPWVSL